MTLMMPNLSAAQPGERQRFRHAVFSASAAESPRQIEPTDSAFRRSIKAPRCRGLFVPLSRLNEFTSHAAIFRRANRV